MVQPSFDIDPLRPRDDAFGAVQLMSSLDQGPGSVRELGSLRSTMRHFVFVLGRVDGEPVGFGFAGTWPGGEEGPCLEADIGVMPAFRRRGVGSALLRTLSDHAGALGHTGLQLEVRDDRADGLDFLLHRGYQQVSRELQFELDLTDAPPFSCAPPPGIEIVTRAERPDLVQGMYEVALDAQGDVPESDGEGPGDFEDWHAFLNARPEHRPELCFLALNNEEVIGSAMLQVFEGGIAYHGGTLVKRAWRRRGIATALTSRQIAAAEASGIRLLRCETEARNEPMRGLLERLGYRPLPSFAVMRGPLRGEVES